MSRLSQEARRMMRLAVAIHKRYSTHQTSWQLSAPPQQTWTRCQVLFRQFELARQRGWHWSAARVRVDLLAALENHQQSVPHAIRAVAASSLAHPVSLREVYQDLLALCEEFNEVTWDLRRGTLSAVTDSITLEDITLGSFEIRLNWKNLPASLDYEVIAADPNPASSSESVTHPHVQSGVLCEGDAKLPLQNALHDGRLLDFFQIVHRTLATYNPSSAYVLLSEWNGRPCIDCEQFVGSDILQGCNRCGEIVCDECVRTCADCECGFCFGCLHECASCEAKCCTFCLKDCDHCGKQICSVCREQERCQLCHEETEEEPPEEEGDATSLSTGEKATTACAAVQPNGVEQVVVPA